MYPIFSELPTGQPSIYHPLLHYSFIPQFILLTIHSSIQQIFFKCCYVPGAMLSVGLQLRLRQRPFLQEAPSSRGNRVNKYTII